MTDAKNNDPDKWTLPLSAWLVLGPLFIAGISMLISEIFLKLFGN